MISNIDIIALFSPNVKEKGHFMGVFREGV